MWSHSFFSIILHVPALLHFFFFIILGDFVSFKLDIDHPDTEMPVALGMLSDPTLAALVDEFFFELHFRLVL